MGSPAVCQSAAPAVTSGAGVPNVSVSVYDSSGSFLGSGRTNASGVYTVTGLPTGSYHLRTSNSAGLIDQFRLWVFPVVVGRGKRLFGDGTPAASLTLVDSQRSTTGVLIGYPLPRCEP